MSQSDDQMSFGCLGLIIGFIVGGLLGLGIGLLFLSLLQALGTGILAAIVGAAILATIGYKSA